MEMELERRLEGMHIKVSVAEMSDGQRFAVIGQSEESANPSLSVDDLSIIIAHFFLSYARLFAAGVRPHLADGLRAQPDRRQSQDQVGDVGMRGRNDGGSRRRCHLLDGERQRQEHQKVALSRHCLLE